MKLLPYLFLILAISCYGQRKKKYFFDAYGKQVTKTEFQSKINHAYNLSYKVENDTAILSNIIVRRFNGKLDSATHHQLQQYLIKISGREIDTTKIVVINYLSGLDKVYSKKDELAHGTIYDSDYIPVLNKIAQNEQFWVNKYPENLDHHHGKTLNWHHDTDAFIEKTFFPYHFNYGSVAIIHPNGNYFIYFGEYGKDEVWLHLKDMVTKYGN